MNATHQQLTLASAVLFGDVSSVGCQAWPAMALSPSGAALQQSMDTTASTRRVATCKSLAVEGRGGRKRSSSQLHDIQGLRPSLNWHLAMLMIMPYGTLIGDHWSSSLWQVLLSALSSCQPARLPYTNSGCLCGSVKGRRRTLACVLSSRKCQLCCTHPSQVRGVWHAHALCAVISVRYVRTTYRCGTSDIHMHSECNVMNTVDIPT